MAYQIVMNNRVYFVIEGVKGDPLLLTEMEYVKAVDRYEEREDDILNDRFSRFKK